MTSKVFLYKGNIQHRYFCVNFFIIFSKNFDNFIEFSIIIKIISLPFVRLENTPNKRI
jgi:hypothetical protein